MAFMDIIMNYVVPVVSGVFILIFITIFGYIIHKAVLKPLGVYRMLSNMMLSMRKKKLFQEEKILEYCVLRIKKNWDEPQVREELLLANKYSKKRIDEIIYVFNTVKKEMQLTKKRVAEDLP